MKIEGVTKLSAGLYRHDATGAIIQHKPRSAYGRNGFRNAGWAVSLGDREVNRWSTLTRAVEEANR